MSVPTTNNEMLKYIKNIVEQSLPVVRENHGTGTGTGSEQTIAHGLSVTPNYVCLTEYNTGLAIPYESTAADETNIYVTAVNLKTYRWYVRYIT